LNLAIQECISESLSFNGQRCTALKSYARSWNIADEFNRQLQSRYAHIWKSLGQISYVNAFYLKRKTSIHSD
jgi:acyl-CoA reductase-like NAD-dependent aldehyde dehydrogenase